MTPVVARLAPQDVAVPAPPVPVADARPSSSNAWPRACAAHGPAPV